MRYQDVQNWKSLNTAGYLISIGLRAVEVADLEARLTDLENKVMGGKK